MKNFLSILALVLCTTSFSQTIHDESYLDQSFVEFKAKLDHSIHAKNLTLFSELLADSINTSEYDCDLYCTKADFIEMNFARNGYVAWEELKILTRWGFARISEASTIDNDNQKRNTYRKNLSSEYFFQAPSFHSKINGFNQLIVLGENVNLRNEAGLSGKVIAKSSYEVFACDCNIVDATETTYQDVDGISWVEIKLKNGGKGYVSVDLTSQGISKELSVQKINGEWKITSFYNPPGC